MVANLMYYFIVNPNAGSGRGLKAWKAIARYLERRNIEYEVFLTHGTGEARMKARELTEGVREPRSIFVVGGDGTVNEAVDGISFHAPVSLGYIPAGTGNDLAKSLRLPAGPVRCFKVQTRGDGNAMMDYGVLTFGRQEVFHRRFLVSAGIGFDAAVCREAGDSCALLGRCLGRLGLGRLRYAVVGIRQFFGCRPSKGYILLDGVRKIEFNYILFISCHIHPSEGGGFHLAFPVVFAAKGFCKFLRKGLPRRRHKVKIQVMIVHAAAIVAHRRAYFFRQIVEMCQKFFQRPEMVFRVRRQRLVQVVDVSLHMTVVVEIHSFPVDIRLQCVISVGKFRKLKRVDRIRKHKYPPLFSPCILETEV